MRRISVLGVTLAVIVVAALAPSATASGRAPRGFAASVKSRCCYYVLSEGMGSFEQDYGTNPKNGVIGTESFTWNWSQGELVKYVEKSDGEPEFRTVETPSGTPAPVQYTASRWTSKSTDGFYGTMMNCGPENYSAPSHLEYYQNFTDVFLTSDTSPNVEKYAKGQKYVLRIIGGDSGLGLTPCGTYSQVALHLEPPPGPNNSEDLADEPEGPFAYVLKLPARNYLRAGGKAEAVTDYESTRTVPESFMACGDHAPMPSCPGEVGYGLHTTTETSSAFATFLWFPYSELQRWIKFFKGGKKPND
jgi:hypothetical protein